MEAQFNERNKNLKQSLNQIVDTVSHSKQTDFTVN